MTARFRPSIWNCQRFDSLASHPSGIVNTRATSCSPTLKTVGHLTTPTTGVTRKCEMVIRFASRPNTLYRQLALMALATAAEQKNDCRQAIESYNEAHKIVAAQQAEALLGKARCLEKAGDTAGALAAYKEYVKDQPGSLMSAKVAELESVKAAPAAATK